MVKIFLTVLISALGPWGQINTQQVEEQDVFVPIAKYLQNGDAERLSAWFAQNLEIGILGVVNVSSKNQAKQVLKDFFNTYTAKSFTMIHKSGTSPMKFAIGNLSAGGVLFRVTIFVNIQDKGTFIQSLRIERQ
jgi:hypothetical protein